MSRVVRAVVGVALVVAGAITGNFQLIITGVSLVGGAILQPSVPKNRAAAAATLQLGEQPRQAVLGRAAVAGSLVDAFNYGGKYSTDWEVLVIALADHRCDALEGFFVDDTYVAFAGDGNVAGYNNQLQVFWRDGQWDQTVPSILTTNGPGWTANDRGRGVAYVVVAYKADASDAKNPVWPGGRPRFRWVVRGLRCYDPRLDSTVGGSGAHRRDNPATWAWSENPIVIRHNWVRGIYAGDRVTEPGMLLIGRGLSAIEAPPANVFPRANLCDEVVGGAARYRIGGVVASTEPFIDVESDFAAAVAGTISQPEGAVEVDPGQAKAPVAHFTDGDLLVGSKVTWNQGILGQQDDGWVNTVAARFVDPDQRWNIRSAPVRRELADVIADRGPRETQPQLDLVTNQPQAQRIAEVIRRFGRLWGRAQVTLPPRFAYIEEGDWVTWQSDRRFGGATRTFRVEAWGSNKAWHHQLTLRQISASVFSDTAPLDDGVIASTRPTPPVVAAPGVGAWNAAAVLLGGGSVRIPNLRIGGANDDPAAQFVVFEYVPQAAAPTLATIWTFAGSSRPEVTLFDIPVPEGGTFWVAVSYVVDGIQGPRRVLGPLSTTGLSFSDGSPVAPVAPANANRVPFSRMEGNQGWALLFNPFALANNIEYNEFQGARFVRASAAATAAGQQITVGTNAPLGRAFRITPGERLSVQTRIEAVAAAGGATWSVVLWTYDTAGAQTATVIANGAAPIGFLASPQQAFVTAPANAVAGRLEYFVVAGGAGTIFIAACEPMITSAAAGQTAHPRFTPGPNAFDGADVTAAAQRSIEPQFPQIEILQGQAGHTGTRTVSHAILRATTALTGGTWSLPAQNLGTGSATINASTGTVSLSGIIQSGSYTVRYTHTDGLPTDRAVNVAYVPTPPSAIVSAKTGRTTSTSGVPADNNWNSIAALSITGAPAGRVRLGGPEGLSFLQVASGVGDASYEARLTLNGTPITSVGGQITLVSGAVQFPDFSGLFEGSFAVAAGTLTFNVQMRRTSGSGNITATDTALEVVVNAT